MQLRSHFRRKRQWDYLPPEIRLVVLETLVEQHYSEEKPTNSLASYASVCRSWQMFFEEKTFRHIILYAYEIATFDRIVGFHRRKFVKHILLHVTLEPNREIQYFVKGADSRSDLENKIYDARFTKAVRDLWSVLSCWDTQGANGNTGLTLELGPEYFCNYESPKWKRSRRHYSRYLENGTHAPANLCLISWLRDMIRDSPDCKPELPPVKVVNSFLIRLRYFPNLSSATLAQILKSLTRLESIRLEQWRCRNCKPDRPWAESGPDLSNLKKLIVYEVSMLKPRKYPKPRVNINLIKHIIETSRHLEQLSISFLIDAREILLRPFSDPEISPDHLKNLTSVALTSQILTSKSDIAINDLLYAAAKAAKCMPRLSLLELWDHRNDEACIFSYQQTEQMSEISWQGTWYVNFEVRVVQIWRDVAYSSSNDRNGRLEVKWLPLMLPGNLLDRPTVIQQLKLKKLVLHEVSLDYA